MTVILLVDVSKSESFGTKQQLKREVITEICAVLSFSAIQNNDKIGLIFFSDQVEKFIPPKKGKGHILRIIRELLTFEPEGKGTNIEVALKFMTNAIKKKSTAFLLSDFIDEGDFKHALKIANKKHDLVALKIYDQRERELPNIGLVPLRDAESGKIRMIDTSNKSVRENFAKKSVDFHSEIENTFKKSGIDFTNISSGESYIKPLMNLFKKRESRR